MENQLAKYLGKELKGSIAKLEVVQGTAKESGNVYYAVEITFINSYKKRLYLRNDEAFAWSNAFEQLETQRQVNAAF